MHARFAFPPAVPLTGWRSVVVSLSAALALSACGGGSDSIPVLPSTSNPAAAAPNAGGNTGPDAPAAAAKPELRCAP
ncbi:hypothetical protein [Variovorax saccharolyticus]|uniref:hypothetical protein n=1 Tax=Variovorax saccharolyticus TaxID=3053516 RepID=UPI0025790F12|nr:hypothetical protein [Variovorax sp. J31P216]MDM0027356.1 hypothetical protein [Variovorax sp. J31P216]